MLTASIPSTPLEGNMAVTPTATPLSIPTGLAQIVEVGAGAALLKAQITPTGCEARKAIMALPATIIPL